MVFRRHGTANILAVFASGSEVTSLGQIQHTGDHTRNGLQAFLLLSHSGDGIKKSLSIRMAGTVDHVIPGAAFHDFAAVHHDDTIRHLGNHRQVMGDQNERSALLLHQLIHELEDLRLYGHIQGGGRLIGDDELRVGSQSDRNDDPLPHTARKLMRVGFQPILRIGDTHHMQQFHTARMLFLLGHLLLVEVQHLGNLFLNGIERI